MCGRVRQIKNFKLWRTYKDRVSLDKNDPFHNSVQQLRLLSTILDTLEYLIIEIPTQIYHYYVKYDLFHEFWKQLQFFNEKIW